MSLDANGKGRLTLSMSPQDSSALSPGTYRLDAWLDTRTGSTATGWTGVSHDTATVQLVAAAATLSPEWQCEQAIQLARYYGDIQNNPSRAVATLDALLATQPTQVNCLVKRGVLAENSGDICGALGLYRRASDAESAMPPPDSGTVEESTVAGIVQQTWRKARDAGCL